jgi:hypothetical protein
MVTPQKAYEAWRNVFGGAITPRLASGSQDHIFLGPDSRYVQITLPLYFRERKY